MMEKVKNRRKIPISLKKQHRSAKNSRNLIVEEMIPKMVGININKPNASVVDVIEDNNDNSLSTDELKSIKTVSSKVTVPNITNDEIIDITNITGGDSTFDNPPTVNNKKTALNINNHEIIDITNITGGDSTFEDFPTVNHKKTTLNINNHEIIDITNITGDESAFEDSPTVNHKKTALNINNHEIIDITDITISSNTHKDVHKQFSSDTMSLNDDDDDLQYINLRTRVQNKSIEPIEIITISDHSDEENTSNQESVEKPNSFKSVHERLGPTTGTVKSSYSSLRNRKWKWEENFITLKKKPVRKFKPQVCSRGTRSRTKRKLRPIIIDGLNIGFAHGSGTFSAKGIELCIQYFADLGHEDIIAFIPQHRRGPPGSKLNIILNNLVKKGQVCFTPSRIVQNTRMTCHDDRIILNYAHKCDGVVVSNDNYRDLYDESEAFKEVIENRQVMVTFVRDEIIVPEDQYNRRSTIRNLSDILCFPE